MTAQDLLSKGFVQQADGSFVKAVALSGGRVGVEHFARAAVERECDLHDDIIAFCKAQHPKWMFIHARMDQRSTIPVGAADFVIFMPGGKILILECKTKTGKCTPEQAGWALQLQMLGHEVHIVRSLEEFLRLEWK